MSLLHLCPPGPLTSFDTTYRSSCTFVQTLLGFQNVSCKPTSDDRSTVLNPFDIDVQYWTEQVSRNDAENNERLLTQRSLHEVFLCTSPCWKQVFITHSAFAKTALQEPSVTIFVNFCSSCSPNHIFHTRASYQACALKSSLSQNDRGFVNLNPLQGITNFFNELRKQRTWVVYITCIKHRKRFMTSTSTCTPFFQVKSIHRHNFPAEGLHVSPL